MPVRNLTRRSVIARGAAAAGIASSPSVAHALTFLRGGSPQGSPPLAGGTVATSRYVNTSVSATPSDVPFTVPMQFVKGDIPAGFIVEPYVAGVLQTYQADEILEPWSDGSMRGGNFRIIRNAATAGSAYISFDFVLTAGSYTNTSSVTAASIAAAVDYKMSLTGVTTAQGGNPDSSITEGLIAAVIVGPSGTITGAKTWYAGEPGTVVARTNIPITNGGGTGALLSNTTTGVITITNPGSGYTTTLTGSFVLSLKAIINAINSGGNFANGMHYIQYAKGPVCNAFVVRSVITGMPHAYSYWYIEEWRKTNGTVLGYCVWAGIGIGLLDTTLPPMPNYTFSADWIGINGSTVIRGVSASNFNFQHLVCYMGSSGCMCDEDGNPDWSVNNAAYNAIIPEKTAAECDYWKRTKMILPFETGNGTEVLPAVSFAFERGSADAGIDQRALYQPFVGTAGIRCPMGGGGGGNEENPMEGLFGLVWKCWRFGNTTSARFWLRNMRIAGLHSKHYPQLGSGCLLDPITLRTCSTVPSAVQSFTGVPDLSAYFIHPSAPTGIKTAGSTNPHIGASGLADALTTTYHQVGTLYPPWVILGHKIFSDAVFYSAVPPISGRNRTRREITLGTDVYYGCYAGLTNNERNLAWQWRSNFYALMSRPPVDANGNHDYERDHLEYVTEDSLKCMVDMIPFLGSVKFGNAAAAKTKTIDLTGMAVWPERFDATNASACDADVQIMLDYVHMSLAVGYAMFDAHNIATYAGALVEHMRPAIVNYWASPVPHYMNTTYRRRVLNGQPPSPSADPTWMGGFSIINPGLAAKPASITPGVATPLMSFVAGSNVVTLSGAVRFNNTGTENMADGSRIRLTTTDLDTASYGGVGSIPTSIGTLIWYHWKGLTPTTGQLCLSAALDDPVTANSTGANEYFWFIPSNTPPPDSAGFEYRHGSPTNAAANANVAYGTLRLLKAAGLGGPNIDAAIANARTMNFANALRVADRQKWPQYTWDETFG